MWASEQNLAAGVYMPRFGIRAIMAPRRAGAALDCSRIAEQVAPTAGLAVRVFFRSYDRHRAVFYRGVETPASFSFRFLYRRAPAQAV